MTLAKIGDEHDVPMKKNSLPPLKNKTPVPCAEMSGNARPVRLNLPSLVEPSSVRYAETAEDWYGGCGKILENPPDEKSAAISGLMPVVAPTLVKKGQPEGKVATKFAQVDG